MDVRNSWICLKPIAHRGLHDDELPENSLAAFDKAVEYGFPIELDVRTIDDGNIVVFHDDKLGRMTGEDGYASGLKTEDLKNIKLLNSDQSIPTFEKVLELIDGRVPILIEIKNMGNAGEFESKTLQMLKGYNGEYAVQSFNPYSLEYFKNAAPDIPRGQLGCFLRKGMLTPVKRYVLNHFRMNKITAPHFIAYNAADLPNRFVTRCNLPTLAWTVRSNSETEAVAPYCDNIIFEKFIPVQQQEKEQNLSQDDGVL